MQNSMRFKKDFRREDPSGLEHRPPEQPPQSKNGSLERRHDG
jgi:hypothetical protein